MPKTLIKKQSPAEEAKYLLSIYGEENKKDFMSHITSSFGILQSRSQMLLSLVTICLTITGFSGPKIIQSGLPAKILIIIGLSLIVCAAIILLTGPLQIKWGTRFICDTFENTLIMQISRRNKRTQAYLIAAIFLVTGLFTYVSSLIYFLITG